MIAMIPQTATACAMCPDGNDSPLRSPAAQSTGAGRSNSALSKVVDTATPMNAMPTNSAGRQSLLRSAKNSPTASSREERPSSRARHRQRLQGQEQQPVVGALLHGALDVEVDRRRAVFEQCRRHGEHGHRCQRTTGHEPSGRRGDRPRGGGGSRPVGSRSVPISWALPEPSPTPRPSALVGRVSAIGEVKPPRTRAFAGATGVLEPWRSMHDVGVSLPGPWWLSSKATDTVSSSLRSSCLAERRKARSSASVTSLPCSDRGQRCWESTTLSSAPTSVIWAPR